VEAFAEKYKGQMAEDIDGAPVFLGKSAWDVNYVAEKNPKVRFALTRERMG
jgi:peptide chain release factor 3